jgi:hypothetical protein
MSGNVVTPESDANNRMVVRIAKSLRADEIRTMAAATARSDWQFSRLSQTSKFGVTSSSAKSAQQRSNGVRKTSHSMARKSSRSWTATAVQVKKSAATESGSRRAATSAQRLSRSE